MAIPKQKFIYKEIDPDPLDWPGHWLEVEYYDAINKFYEKEKTNIIDQRVTVGAREPVFKIPPPLDTGGPNGFAKIQYPVRRTDRNIFYLDNLNCDVTNPESDSYRLQSATGYDIWKSMSIVIDKREEERKLQQTKSAAARNRKEEKAAGPSSSKRKVVLKELDEDAWKQRIESNKIIKDAEITKKKGGRYLNDEIFLSDTEYTGLEVICENLSEQLAQDTGVLELFGLSPELYRALKEKLRDYRRNIDAYKDEKFLEYENILETQHFKESQGWDQGYLLTIEENSIFTEPFHFTIPKPPKKSVFKVRGDTPAVAVKAKIHVTEFDAREFHYWRRAHRYYFNDEMHKRYNRNFFSFVLETEPDEDVFPPELTNLVMIQYYVKRTQRIHFDPLSRLCYACPYFARPCHNIFRGSHKYYFNGGPFIEANFMGLNLGPRVTAPRFNWNHFKKTSFIRNVYKLNWIECYKDLIYYRSQADFVCQDESVVQFLHDDWDGFRIPFHNAQQRCIIHENKAARFPLSFYKSKLHRVAAQKNWVIGLPHKELARWTHSFITQAYVLRHLLTGAGFLALFIGHYFSNRQGLYRGLTIVQLMGAAFYRIYYGGTALIDYEASPNIFHFQYSPNQVRYGIYTTYIERQSESLSLTMDRNLYKLSTALMMLQAFYRLYWPDSILCTVPCHMVPPHPYPYHPDGTGRGIFSFPGSPDYGLRQLYAPTDMGFQKANWWSPIFGSVGWLGMIVIGGLTIGAVVVTTKN